MSPLKAIYNIFRAFKKQKLFSNIGGVTEFGQFDHSIKGHIKCLNGSRLLTILPQDGQFKVLDLRSSGKGLREFESCSTVSGAAKFSPPPHFFPNLS